MKKNFILLALASFCFIADAQPVLYGLTSGNNYLHNNGSLYKYDASTNTCTTLLGLPNIGINPLGAYGTYPYGSLLQAADGKFYGVTLASTSRDGILFSFDRTTGIFTNLLTFDNTRGNQPHGSLIQLADGKLYGLTTGGGIAGAGTIFSFDPTSLMYTKLKDFDGTNGGNPMGSLFHASDGKLYGLSSGGGTAGGGVIFSFDPVTMVYSKLKDFDSNSGLNPYGNLLQASDGKMYGLTPYGGSFGLGVVFSFNPVTLVYTKLKDLDNASGARAFGSLIQATDGKLYGLTHEGGNAGYGAIFSMAPATGVYTKLKDFGYADGNNPYGTLLQASDGKLYGMTHDGGSNGIYSSFGALFSFDPVNNAYAVLNNFVSGSPFYTALIEPGAISTSALPTNSFCAGSSVTVAYSTKGLFNSGNVFTVQLSDAAGSFANPATIGSLSGTTTGSINASLPPGILPGSSYRIRVVANNPVTYGTDNGTNINIKSLPIVTLFPYGDVCVTDPPFALTGGTPAGGTYSGKAVTNNQFDPSVGAGTYTITYSYTGKSGCTATAKQSLSVTKPCTTCKAIITASGPTTFCDGGKLTLTASAGNRYLWSTGATTQTITVTAGGDYTVKVTDANKCAAVASPVTVTVNPLPAQPVISAGGNTTFCLGGSISLTTDPASGYLWSSGETTQSISATSSGVYTVAVTNAQGCSAGSAPVSVTATNCTVYCTSAGNILKGEYIQKVTTSNGINNSSGLNNGYADFTNLIGTSALSTAFQVTITPGFTGGLGKLGVFTKVWIDWNQNGDFNNPGELVFAPGNASTADQTGQVSIPKSATPGYTRMRVVMSAYANPSCCGKLKSGEVEDYSILITSASARIANTPATEFNKLAGQAEAFTVLPNPVFNSLLVRQMQSGAQSKESSKTLLRLMNADGKLLLETRMPGLTQSLDLSRFSNGIYFLHITSANTNTIKKIYIQH